MDRSRVDKNGVKWSRWVTMPDTVKEYIEGLFWSHSVAFVMGVALTLAWMH